jgi:hypothetical protein
LTKIATQTSFEEVARKTTSELPFGGAYTHWSGRLMGAEVGRGHSAAIQLSSLSGVFVNLAPRLLRTFTLNKASQFVENAIDVVNLYPEIPFFSSENKYLIISVCYL